MSEDQHYLSPALLSLRDVAQMLQPQARLVLSAQTAAQIQRGRDLLETILAREEAPVYGINTGFGALVDTRISSNELEALQLNLIRSHSAGAGALVPEFVTQLILALKIQSLLQGHSGVRLVLVQRLIDMFNARCFPVLYELGSLGASGDLAPLAHLSLPLVGEGEVFLEGKRLPSSIALLKQNWGKLTLQSKEGLALLNGTQFSTSYAVVGLLMGWRLWRDANRIAGVSIEGFNALLVPFDARIQAIRPHLGQIRSAAEVRNWLQGSEIASAAKESLQDPYCFRCVPQVHGATYDALQHATQQLLTEVNSVTDNPNLFFEGEEILSGGNFHAQAVALVADYMAIALAELGSISERRTYQLIGGKRGLPPFLTENPGLHSGFMIAQYTAAAIVSQNKQLCSPASVDSIVSCNGQEDHVSMAANAGTKLLHVAQNVERLLAIELMVATQALEFRRPLRSAPQVEEWLAQFRKVVPRLKADRILSIDMEAARQFLADQPWHFEN